MNTRTNIVLDDTLIAQAMLRARVTTKKAAVEAALRAYVQKPDYTALLALEGARLICDDYDPKGVYLAPVPEPIAALNTPLGQSLAKRRSSKTMRKKALA